MSADTIRPFSDTDTAQDLEACMLDMGQRARAASLAMSALTPDQRTAGLKAMAEGLREALPAILEANRKDLASERASQLSPALIDRLTLDEARVAAMADGVDAIAALSDPIGRELARWTVPSGLDIARVACPLGVIGIIYESRPNVTSDAGALCVRSGNAAILRGGSESAESSAAIVDAMRSALVAAGLPADAVQRVPTTDRAAVGHLLSGLGGTLDVVVPRGGKGLVARVQDEARVPVIGHLEGLCHMYVDASADLKRAPALAVNAKMRRTGICGALETLLIDRAVPADAVRSIADALIESGCELRGDAAFRAIVPAAAAASEEDWATEYLAPVLSVAVVDSLDGALAHIGQYGTGHTEAIVADDAVVAARFLNEVDAAIVMHNASTQFADGAQFGMGAEIGIATGRMHARGPVGADQLTIYKYVVRGTGQTRP